MPFTQRVAARAVQVNITMAEARKAIVAICGVAAMALNQGFVHGTVAKWISIGLAVATAFGVYMVPNKQKSVPAPIDPPPPPVPSPAPAPPVSPVVPQQDPKGDANP